MKQLERLLFLQGSRCFFCAQPIPDGEASVEHLIATSNGGPKDDENCIVCCKVVNAALGNLSIKAKLQVILNQRGAFNCPNSDQNHSFDSSPLENGIERKDDKIGLVVADLIKRGASRPRKVATLKNTMNSVFQMQLSETELDTLMVELQRLAYITLQDTKVTYALSARDA